MHARETGSLERSSTATRAGSRWIYLSAALGLALVAWVMLDGERHLFSTAPTPVSVEVRASDALSHR